MTHETLDKRTHLLKEPKKNKSFLNNLRSIIYKKFGVWDVFDIVPRSWKYYYYDFVRPIFSPCHKKLRKSIPRTWVDLSHVVVDVNFQIIKSFYEDEFLAETVDWDNSSEGHKEFAKWLERAYMYITKDRIELEKQMNDAYPETKPLNEMFVEEVQSDGKVRCVYKPRTDKTYNELYGEVNRLEKLINDTDAEILIALIKNRDYLWT